MATKESRQLDPPISAEQMLAALADIVPDLARALGPDHELVVHDLSRIPNSIIAIGGGITGRCVGGAITDFLLRAVRQGKTDSLFRYRSRTADGRTLNSSTVFVRTPEGEAIGCLCINRDISDLLEIEGSAERMKAVVDSIDGSADAPREGDGGASEPEERDGGASDRETFVPSVDELASLLVDRAIARVGVPVELMQKRHKAQVIADLEESGLFMLRDAVDFAATTLGISRESVYIYLREMRAQPAAASRNDSRAGARRLSTDIVGVDPAEGEE